MTLPAKGTVRSCHCLAAELTRDHLSSTDVDAARTSPHELTYTSWTITAAIKQLAQLFMSNADSRSTQKKMCVKQRITNDENTFTRAQIRRD